MKRKRAFSLVEIMVVIAVIGISGSLTVFAMSDQIGDARARSDQVGMYLRFKAERDRARERMVGMAVDSPDGGHTIRFRRAESASGTCIPGDEIGRATFSAARVIVGGSTACLDETGRPVGPVFSMQITTDLPDVPATDVSVSTAGVIETTGTIVKVEDVSGATTKPPEE